MNTREIILSNLNILSCAVSGFYRDLLKGQIPPRPQVLNHYGISNRDKGK